MSSSEFVPSDKIHVCKAADDFIESFHFFLHLYTIKVNNGESSFAFCGAFKGMFNEFWMFHILSCIMQCETCTGPGPGPGLSSVSIQTGLGHDLGCAGTSNIKKVGFPVHDVSASWGLGTSLPVDSGSTRT